MHRPLVHFLLIGTALFLVTSWWSEDSTGRTDRLPQDTIVISDAMIARLTDEWIARYASPPTALERQAMIDAEINYEILHREALRLEMHLADPVVEARLTQNMRFLTEGDAVEAAEDEALLREALDLDMAVTDIVVRRRLIQQMQSVLESAAIPPSLQEVGDYVEQHPDRFATLSRFEVSYQFERRGRSGAHVAPIYSGGFSERKLALHFGPTGAERIRSLEPGESTGPIHHSDGVYRIRLDKTIPARLSEFERIRARADHALMQERRKEALDRALRQLRGLYTIQVGGARVPL